MSALVALGRFFRLAFHARLMFDALKRIETIASVAKRSDRIDIYRDIEGVACWATGRAEGRP